MSRILNLVLAVLLSCNIFSCGFYEEKIADKHLHPDTMKIVLYELYLADEMNANRIYKDSTLNRQKENLTYYDQIFNNHRISSKDFFSSLEYYQDHPKLFSMLTDSLNNYAQKIVSKELSAPFKK
jgi:hypothetical protein